MLRKIRKMLKHQEGFTLVELMIVVVILGILAGVGIQQYGLVQERARNNVHQANLRILQSAAQMYVLLEETIPTTEPQGGYIADLKAKGYLEEVPESPWDNGEAYKVDIDTSNGAVTVSGGEVPTPLPS